MTASLLSTYSLNLTRQLSIATEWDWPTLSRAGSGRLERG